MVCHRGTCNWLSTDFVSFEASVRLRDPALAGEIVNHLAALSMGSRGVWHQTANDLTVLARKIRLLPVALGRKAKLRILSRRRLVASIGSSGIRRNVEYW